MIENSMFGKEGFQYVMDMLLYKKKVNSTVCETLAHSFYYKRKEFFKEDVSRFLKHVLRNDRDNNTLGTMNNFILLNVLLKDGNIKTDDCVLGYGPLHRNMYPYLDERSELRIKKYDQTYLIPDKWLDTFITKCLGNYSNIGCIKYNNIIMLSDYSHYWFIGNDDILYSYDTVTNILTSRPDTDFESYTLISGLQLQYLKEHEVMGGSIKSMFEEADNKLLKYEFFKKYSNNGDEPIPYQDFFKVFGPISKYLDSNTFGLSINDEDYYGEEFTPRSINKEDLHVLDRSLFKLITQINDNSETERDVLLGLFYQYVNTLLPKGTLVKWLTDCNYNSLPGLVYNARMISVIINDTDNLFINIDRITGMISITVTPLCK